MRATALLPLVGRNDALADAERVLDAARESHGGLLLVTGEAGIGKTRLAEEVAARAQGFTSVWSWCASDRAAGSFRPWVQVVHELAAGYAPVARLVTDSPYLGALLSHDVLVGDPLADTEAVRTLFVDAVAAVVRSAAAHRPLLVILDDLHAAQESSLWLLAHLVPTLRSTAAVVLATARDGERDWHGHIEARAALVRQASSLRLSPLSATHVAELVRHVAGAPPPAHLPPRLAARTGGNPFLIAELVRLLRDRQLDGAALDVAVPASVRAIAAERMAGFSPACQRLLGAAATLGTRFRLDVLADVTHTSLAEVRPLLEDAELAGLVELAEPGAGRFVHELLRDAAYEQLPTVERSAWHARAGAVLRLRAERGRETGPAEVAHHLLLAGPDVAEAAALFAHQAGDRAAELLAFEDAAGWYERALQVLELTRADTARRATLLLALGEVRLGCGERARARDGFLRATVLARQAGLAEVLARAALGLGSGPAGFEVGLLDRERLDLLEEARQLLPADQLGLRALVTARLSVAATLVEPEAQRLALANDGVRLARLADDDAAQAYALAALCDALAGPDHCRARVAYAAEIVERATRLRSPALELLGRRLRLMGLLELGDRPAAEAEMTAYRIRAEAFGHPLYRWYVPLWRGMWALAEGRFADCASFNQLVEREGRAAGSDNAAMLSITQLWCLLAELEDRDGLEERFSVADLDTMPGIWPRVTIALVMAQLGRPDVARQRLDAVAPQLGSLPRDSEWLPCLAQVAEIIALIGPHPLAPWAYATLRPYAGLWAVEGIGAALRGPIERHLSLLATACGDPDAARDHAARAVEQARALGATALVGRIQHEAAEPREAGEGWSTPAAPASPDNLFHRHGDVWSLSFAGRSVQLRDSKGLRDLAVLLAQPGTHVAALDLASPGAGPHPAGDAGELLDLTARKAYADRLIELEHEADEADVAGDRGRSAHIAAEREALVQQLTAAYGLGGRGRRAGSIAERARSAVTVRIRDAIKRIGQLHPELGRHLHRSVRTGTFCVYEPETPTHWRLTP